MFRKFFAICAAAMLVAGGLFAEPISGVFKKVDGSKVTIEVDGKATDYKIADVKVKVDDKVSEGSVILVIEAAGAVVPASAPAATPAAVSAKLWLRIIPKQPWMHCRRQQTTTRLGLAHTCADWPTLLSRTVLLLPVTSTRRSATEVSSCFPRYQE